MVAKREKAVLVRLSDKALESVAEMSEYYGLSKTDVIRISIGEKWLRHEEATKKQRKAK